MCEELVDDYDEEIVTVLQQVADNELTQAEESICVRISHLCSKKEYNRVKNYDYRDSLGDFQKQQNIRSMSLDEMNDYEDFFSVFLICMLWKRIL